MPGLAARLASPLPLRYARTFPGYHVSTPPPQRRALLSVRTKLALLVGLPVLLMGLVVPVLGEVHRRELIDAADDHVQAAERSFEAERGDDLADLKLAAQIMAVSLKTKAALQSGDARQALEVAQVFARLYPRLDIILAMPDGRVLGDVGPSDAPKQLQEIPELSGLVKAGSGASTQAELQVITAHGCARSGSSAPPSHALLRPVEQLGWVVACEPLDAAYLQNAADKINVELAFLAGGQMGASTRGFPRGAVAAARTGTTVHEVDGRTWAVQRFTPRLLEGGQGKGHGFEVAAAVDISKTSSSMRRHLRITLGLLLLIALIAVGFGARVAGVMAGGLRELIAAYRKLADQVYVRVPVLRTRDEIELLATGFNQMVEGLMERDKLRTTFGKYMTESVLQHLLGGKVELGGETLKVTILFSDIRSFTTISEKMDAHALVALLNEYFTEMVGIIMRNGGVVDKYIGDAIMAVFGAPVPGPADAANAVRAAVEMRAALITLNQRLAARGMQELRTGIGIHTGEVVAGNIGSEQRMEYTVIGDPVNVAARLETNTKDLGVNVLISEATYLLTREIVETRPVKALTVKGRAEPVMTYEVLGTRDVDAAISAGGEAAA
jgi:adenylate cyclase